MSKRIRAFVVAAVIGGAAAFFFLSATAPQHVIVAQFENASGLVPGNDVRIHGVVAGTVLSVDPEVDRSTGAQYAQARLEIDDASWPLHVGSGIAITPKGVLSSVYVEITPATGGSALAANTVIPVNQTTSPINLDVLTDEFTPDVRTAIQVQLAQGAIALGSGGAPALNATIAKLDPLLQAALPTADVLAARSPQLDALNSEFDVVSAKLAKEDTNLRSLISASDVTFSAIAAKQTALVGTLENADTSLTDLNAILSGEQGNLRAVFSKGPQALALAKENVDSLLPLVTDVNPHIASLDQLLTELLTATGFNTGTIGGIDTLRVDGTLPESGHTAVACGGDPHEQSCGSGSGATP